MPYYSELASYWYQVKKVGVVPARSIVCKRCAKWYLLIVVRLDVDGQSFAPIGLHKIDAASDWLLTKRLAGSSDTKLIGQHKQSA